MLLDWFFEDSNNSEDFNDKTLVCLSCPLVRGRVLSSFGVTSKTILPGNFSGHRPQGLPPWALISKIYSNEVWISQNFIPKPLDFIRTLRPTRRPARPFLSYFYTINCINSYTQHGLLNGTENNLILHEFLIRVTYTEARTNFFCT